MKQIDAEYAHQWIRFGLDFYISQLVYDKTGHKSFSWKCKGSVLQVLVEKMTCRKFKSS